MHNKTYFGTYLCYVGTQHRNLLQSSACVRIVTTSRVTYLFCGPTHEAALATAYTGTNKQTTTTNRERFEKNEGEWTGQIKIISKKKSLAVGEACMAIF